VLSSACSRRSTWSTAHLFGTTQPDIRDAPSTLTTALILRQIGLWLRSSWRFGCLVALLAPAIAPLRKMKVDARSLAAIVLTFVAGPWIAGATVVLKDNWHRPRPVQVTEFGGHQPVQALVGQPRGPVTSIAPLFSGEVSVPWRCDGRHAGARRPMPDRR